MGSFQAIDPDVNRLLQFLGVIENGELNSDWLKSPLHELKTAFQNDARRQILLDLFADLVDTSDAQVQGIPGENADETWYAIPNIEPVRLFITTKSHADGFVLGLAVKWQHRQDSLSLNAWASMPLLLVTDSANPVVFAPTAIEAPMVIGFSAQDTQGFGDPDGVSFSGCELNANIFLGDEHTDPSAELHITLRDFKLAPSDLAADLDLGNLDNIDYAQLQRLVTALIGDRVRRSGPVGERIVKELFPLLGLSGERIIEWSRLVSDGIGELKQWFAELVSNRNSLQQWLQHAYRLLVDEAADAAADWSVIITGSGTRPDPYCMRINPLAQDLSLFFTVAATIADNGEVRFYPGLKLISAPVELATNSDTYFSVQSRAELFGVSLNGASAMQILPSFKAQVRVFNSSAPLVSHDFSQDQDLGFLGTYSVGELGFGVEYTVESGVKPSCELHDVRSSAGNWLVVDLLNGDEVLNNVQAIGQNVVEQAIRDLFQLDSPDDHPAKHFAALLGLVSPSGFSGAWPIALNIHLDRIALFLSQPTAAVASYHAACIEQADNTNTNHWFFMLGEVVQLFGWQALRQSGSGTLADPWRITLYEQANGDAVDKVDIAFSTDSSGARPLLGLHWLVEPHSVSVSDTLALHSQIQVDWLQLLLPPAADASVATEADSLIGASAMIQLKAKPQGNANALITLQTALGLQFSASEVALESRWVRSPGDQQSSFDWQLSVKQFEAHWSGVSAESIALPRIDFGGNNPLNWDFDNLPNGLDLPTLGRLFRLCIGSWLVQRGGRHGIGFACLFGFIPSGGLQLDLPNLNFDWQNSPFSFPQGNGGEVDWPQFEPNDWLTFFENPWPELWAHFQLLLSSPQWSLPSIRLLGGMLSGGLPNLNQLDFGLQGDGLGAFSLPSSADLPFHISGEGTYESPWKLTLSWPEDKPIELLFWLDPDGPGGFDINSVAKSLLPEEWQNLAALVSDEGFGIRDLAAVLHSLASLVPPLAGPMATISSEGLGDGLVAVQELINTTDGVVLAEAQITGGGIANWTDNVVSPAISCDHFSQLQDSEMLLVIANAVQAVPGNLPVLCLGAAWESVDAWLPLQAQLGASFAEAAVHFDMRELGVDPSQIGLAEVSGTANSRFFVGDVAAFNTAPSLDARTIPVVSAGSEDNSQLNQVKLMVQRVLEITGQNQVIIVAHSHAALPAIALQQEADGQQGALDSGIASIVTVAAPLRGASVFTGIDEAARQGLSEGLGFLNRMLDAMVAQITAPEVIKNAIDFLYQALQGRLDIPAIVDGAFPEHAFEPLNHLNLSIPCTAIASKLPEVHLKLILLPWLQTEMAEKFAERRVPTHFGYGFQFTGEHRSNKLRFDQRSRIDIGRIALPTADDHSEDDLQALPRLRISGDVYREDGWLVGDARANPRLRSAQFSLSVDAQRTVPDIVLHDAYLDGIALAKTSLRDVLQSRGEQQQSGGNAFDPEALLQRLMGELEELIEELPKLNCAAQMLSHIGLMQKLQIPEVGNNPPMEIWIFRFEGWQQFLNDAEGYLRNQVTEIIASDDRRAALLSTLTNCFDCDVFPLNLLKQVNADGSTIQLKPLIKVLQALRLLLESEVPIPGPNPNGLPECFPNIDNARALLCDPKAYVESLFKEVISKPAIIDRLRSQINRELGLHRINKPEQWLNLGEQFSFKCTATGVYQLCYELNEQALGIELHATLCLTVDLEQQQLTAKLKVCPTAIGLAVNLVADYSLDGGELADAYRVSMGQCGNLAYPDFTLPIYPLPSANELKQTFEQTLPKFLLNTVVAELCDQHIFDNPSAESLAEFIECLGLAYRRNGGKYRLRPLDGLLDNPVGWLKQPFIAGSNVSCIDTAAVVSLFNCFAKAIDITDAQGNIVLAGGLILACDNHHGARFSLMSPHQGLPFGDVDLQFVIACTIRENCDVSASARGDVALNVNLGANLLALGLAFQLDSQTQQLQLRHQFNQSLNTLWLYPFTGWQGLLEFGADQAMQLLNTLLDATLRRLEQEGGELALFVQRLRAVANALDLNSEQTIQDLYNNPSQWLRNCVNSNAGAIWNAAISSVNDLVQQLQVSLPLSASNGKLCYHYPDVANSTLSVCLGIDAGRMGMWASLDSFALEPLEIDASLALTSPVAQLNQIAVDADFSLDLKPIDPLVTVGTQEIAPNIALRLSSVPNAANHFCRLYPLGDNFPVQLYLQLIPSVSFEKDQDALLLLIETVVMPSLLEMLLDTPAVTNALNQDLAGGFELGNVLVDCALLVRNGSGFDLQFPYDDLDPKTLLISLLRSLLNTLIDSGNSHLAQGQIEIVRLQEGAASHWGIRLALDGLNLKKDPELVLNIGAGDASWISRSGGNAASEGGLYFYLPYQASNGADLSLLPRVDAVNLGMAVSGKNDQALMDLGYASLNGFDFKTFFSIVLGNTVSTQFGASVAFDQLGISMGGAGSGSAVASNLLGSDTGEGGDTSKVNPAFSIELSYANELDVQLSGQSASQSEVWFPIQKTMGPVHVSQLGVRWHSSEKAIEMLLDGGVSLAGLNVVVDDLGLKVPIETFDQLNTWSIGLRGLGVSYNKGGIKVSGALLQTDSEGNEYSGACLVQAGGKTFTAIGAYSRNPETSMFVFVLLPLPIGGPPFLFITGLAGGFGYNRGLNVPPVDGVNEFPLVQAALGSGGFSEDPMNALQKLGGSVPVKSGAYWLAGGIRFTSFELAKSVALAYVLLDRGLEIGLLGLTQMKLPENSPLVNLEMALKARFSSADGLISVEARLTDNSWLLSKDCRLTGGFAFYLWFAGPYKSDFVITLGGYHPKFVVPKHYPEVPRLGFNWRVTSKVTIKGESYFALTSAAVMAGGLLEASYKSGNLKAWFKAWADFLIQWKPFYYAIGVGVSVGVSYRLKVNLLFGTVTKTFKAELGADLEIEGPDFGGKATINWWVISFTVKFGSQGGPSKAPLSWKAFSEGFLPSLDEVHGADVVSGVIPQEATEGSSQDMVLQTEFVISTETVMGTNRVEIFNQAAHALFDDMDIRPMKKANVTSTHKVTLSRVGTNTPVVEQLLSSNGDQRVFRTDTGGLLTVEIKRGRVPSAMWELDGDGAAKAEAKLVNSITGINIIAEVLIDDNHTGEIPVMELFESGTLPLPFAIEREQRSQITPIVQQKAALQFSEDPSAIFKAASLVLGRQWLPHRDNFLSQVDNLGANVARTEGGAATAEQLSRDRVAPPQLASRYENMGGESQAESRDDAPENSGPRPGDNLGELHWYIPRLWAVLRRPLVIKPEIIESISTSVSGLLAENSSSRVPVRVDVSHYRGYNAREDLGSIGQSARAEFRQISRSSGYASLRRVSNNQQQRSAALGGTAQAYVMNAKANAGMRSDAKLIEQRAFSRKLGSLSSVALKKTRTEAQGNVVLAGTTQIWDLPTKNTQGNLPSVWFRGDQALRLTAFDKVGELIEDWESTRKIGLWKVPQGTARLAVTGLGASDRVQRKPNGAGAASQQTSRSGLPVYGWQQSSQLVPVSGGAYLARGAVVNSLAQTGPNDAAPAMQLMLASKVSHQAEAVSTALPLDTELVIVQLQQGANAAGDIFESVQLSSNDADLLEAPVMVEANGFISLIYAQKTRSPFAAFSRSSAFASSVFAAKKLQKNQETHLQIDCSTVNGWQLTGVIGAHGSINDWKQRLEKAKNAVFVDNGLLAAKGSSMVQFKLDPKAAAQSKKTNVNPTKKM